MKKKKQFNKDSTSWLVVIITILFLSIIPILVRITAIQYPMDQFNWYHPETQSYDIYNLFKSKVILGTGLFSLVLLIFRQYKYKILKFKDPIFITACVFASLILLSHFTSLNAYVSSRGYITRYEGVWVWLSYLSTFLLIYSFKWTKDQLKLLAKSFIIINFVLSIIGVFQYFGLDLILNDFTRPFVTALNMKDLKFSTVYSLNYTVIIQTLFHYNYVAFYITLSLPFALTILLYDESKKNKIFYGLLSILIFFNLLGSGARAGLLGIAVAIPFFIYLNRRFLFKRMAYAFIFIGVIIVLVGGFEVYSDGFISKRILSTFTSIEAPNVLKSVTTDEDEITILIHDDEFKIKVINSDPEVWDMKYFINDEPVQTVNMNNENKLYFDHPSLSKVLIYMVKFSDDADTILSVDIMNSNWRFDYSDEGLQFRNPYGYLVDIDTPEVIGFENKERLGSSRGYIWSRSLPLILDQPFLGYGPDTFALVFPQHDYVGKYNAYNTTNMVVDKAHNLYIQIAINSGILALISYLAFTFIFFKRSIDSLKLNHWKFNNYWVSAVFVSLIAYSISSIFNDSTVSVSPTFWSLLAIGLNQLKCKE